MKSNKTDAQYLTPSQYATLRNLNRSTIYRQISKGALHTTADGLLDVKATDEARRTQLSWTRPRKAIVPLSAETFDEIPESELPAGFSDGVDACALRLAKTARATWPKLLAEADFAPFQEGARVSAKAYILAIMLRLTEAWVRERIDLRKLPAIDYTPFGADAADVQAGVKELLKAWK